VSFEATAVINGSLSGDTTITLALGQDEVRVPGSEVAVENTCALAQVCSSPMNGNILIDGAVGDTLQLMVYSSSTSTLVPLGGADSVQMTIRQIS
jgi:hypothetical protein